jgi:hypothetical protein
VKVKGKPWSAELEKQLRELVESGKSAAKIAVIMEKSYASVSTKIKRLGLQVDDDGLSGSLLSSTLELPKELPSVETILKKAAAALAGLETPGLSKTEVMRLRAIIQSAAVYQVKIAEYMDYRRIEAKLIDVDEKYERLVRERRKNTKTG